MSHFSVAIITEGVPTEEKIRKALAPYQENNMGDCPKEFLEFHSLSEEYIEEYEKGVTDRVQLKDGTLVSPWDDCLYKEVTKTEYEKARAEGKSTTFRGQQHFVKYDLEEIGASRVQLPWKEIYPTFENYLEEYHEAEKDEETNDYGYWENPNAKWDWYQIGGRWAGKLKVPADCENYGIGEKSWGWGNEDPYSTNGKYKKADSARIKDLVFPEYEEKYNAAKRFWELKFEGQQPQSEREKELLKWDFYADHYYTNTYKDKETYAECEATFHTYAVIDKNGNWFAKGEMGWWGVSSSAENQEVNYIKNYKKNVFDNAGDNDYITVVDCHI